MKSLAIALVIIGWLAALVTLIVTGHEDAAIGFIIISAFVVAPILAALS